MSEDIDDLAFERNEEFDDIASELFEVDKSGVLLQGIMSVLIATTASISSYFAANVSVINTVFIFILTFLPNFGLKVIAELIKKRSLVKGMRKGYKKGRKDSILDESAIIRMKKWSEYYKMLESATFGGSR